MSQLEVFEFQLCRLEYCTSTYLGCLLAIGNFLYLYTYSYLHETHNDRVGAANVDPPHPRNPACRPYLESALHASSPTVAAIASVLPLPLPLFDILVLYDTGDDHISFLFYRVP
ncbi:hypothetical protein LXG23DRAFT_39522 [Yarrowia lipolytica]|nr:hypothetical protein LXG23DRAFT_39522 [Yarrowia lipolytica]